MVAVKRSVSVDEDVWVAAERLAGGSPSGMSGVVTDALREVLARQDGLAAMAEWQARHGAFTEDELAAADRELDRAGVPDLRHGTPLSETS